MTSELGLEGSDLGCQLGNVFFSGHGEMIALRVSRLKLSSTVRVCLRPGMCYVLVLTELHISVEWTLKGMNPCWMPGQK